MRLPAYQLPTGSSRARAWLPNSSIRPVTGMGGSVGRGQARAHRNAGRQDRHRSASAQDRQRRQAPLCHPHKIDKDGRRHYLIRGIPYQDPSGRPNGSRRCMRRGSRSSPESEQRRRDSTLDIADYLKISVHTVQSHLRNIFTKPEYAPRCDLVTKIFFAHYEPRLRDNEQRTAANLPLRGGPAGAHSPHRRPGRAQAEPATK
jgi:hypothetical protein